MKKASEDPAAQQALSALASFDFQPRTRLIFGEGTAARAGELARELQARHVLLVTDPGLARAGHAALIQRSLEAAGLRVTLYAEAQENPTASSVDACAQAAAKAGIDTLIGLGGGSAMDTAKGCNFILTNGGHMRDYWGVGKAAKPMLPLIAIPTTSGTGSECQSAALIADEVTHVKMACLDPKAAARVALLDPLLTLSQPARVTACTGLDALSHALESAVCLRSNAVSLMFARESFALCFPALPQVLREPGNVSARGRMLLGAALAGLAIETSMLGAAHAAANPLTARYGVIHGHAIGLMLPHVFRFNSEIPGARAVYDQLFERAMPSDRDVAASLNGNACEDLNALVQEVLRLGDLAPNLKNCGVEHHQLPSLAKEAEKQWTASFNPRKATQEDFASLYEAAYQ